MNYHFLSFLFDVTIWLAFSIGLTKLVTDAENLKTPKMMTTGLTLGLTALCTGCFSVTEHGLPETGFAWYTFFWVAFLTFATAVFLSPRLKVKVKQAGIILLSYAYLFLKDVKGGVETYGNSR